MQNIGVVSWIITNNLPSNIVEKGNHFKKDIKKRQAPWPLRVVTEILGKKHNLFINLLGLLPGPFPMEEMDPRPSTASWEFS